MPMIETAQLRVTPTGAPARAATGVQGHGGLQGSAEVIFTGAVGWMVVG
jgi:hypothetical protein